METPVRSREVFAPENVVRRGFVAIIVFENCASAWCRSSGCRVSGSESHRFSAWRLSEEQLEQCPACSTLAWRASHERTKKPESAKKTEVDGMWLGPSSRFAQTNDNSQIHFKLSDMGGTISLRSRRQTALSQQHSANPSKPLSRDRAPLQSSGGAPGL